MALVEIRESESLEDALRRFRKISEREGISREIKKRSFYEKPSLMKKKKLEAKQRKLQKKLRKLKAKGLIP
ncbi:MAG TPA: 30S ribosomal protein S21 [Spirochaetia bacterium]|nr:MAG: 30S ribosomal protein S21 [Spirochaetes bacterium GWB1_36_13]HCL57649.1 30S ribosomal protein S21 [Spirochaetia bacterium]